MSNQDPFMPDDVNPTSNEHIGDLMQARLSRRQALAGGVGIAAGAWLAAGTGVALAADGRTRDRRPPNDPPALVLGFKPVDKNRLDVVTVPEGYRVSVLHALGDPMHFGDASWRDDGKESAESYDRRIGDGHDGMFFFGMAGDGRGDRGRPAVRFDPGVSDRGLLCVNHEYVVSPYALHPSGPTRQGDVRTVASEVDKEVLAHGVSIVEVRRHRGADMRMVRGSPYNRRITAATPMAFGGPVRGSALVRTKHSPDGTVTRGTNNNCANGHTPWGTYLTCEENFTNVISRVSPDRVPDSDPARRSPKEETALQRYGMANGRRSPYAWDTASTDDRYARWNCAVTATAGTAADDYRNVFNTFGWVVEIDPFRPDSTPVKRTALGRFAHEGAWPAPAVEGQPIVIYMGDDSRNEYIYKFVSRALWTRDDVGKGAEAGAKYLDDGTLFVARFDADGTGQWIELTHGVNGLTASHPVYPFADQADVLVHARLAGDAVGATKMDRPEWSGVNPRNGEVYVTLTNNDARHRVSPTSRPLARQARPDAANPRFYDDGEGNKGNPNGHIIRWKESGSQAGRGFRWDVYLFGAESDAAVDVNLSGLTAANDFSSPDGLSFDSRGLLWIQTDDRADADISNCMMLAAVPGRVGDGTTVRAAGGTLTLRGALASERTLRRFLVGPRGCEITGTTLTPDGRTLFCNVQHPGEGSTLSDPSSHWPDSQSNPASTRRPRSATVVITRKDGGPIALA